MTDLVPFPLDDETLDLIDLALDPTRTGRSSLGDLLDILSGYNPDLLQSTDQPDVVEYPNPVYSSHDLIRALVAEVRRLRAAT